ncbi:uncharacterized protein AB675_5689 [Cyphellophora attinorum]|uniref:CASTOR ACT domain-containing protein n=1 Tax=Cyphellophora attinorum TaxID=1664694 RepID=A0A0N1P0F5_9EURO|nr:uncharacterized protein AB675_5689 [Phialophora attinorum]KPI42165.1 hypothetical protein AB675_5689 [Phialophora attinorum]
MTDSLNLMMAQISFLEPHLVLIHIPTGLYTLFLQPIQQLLFADDNDPDQELNSSWTNRHDFLNVSITPEGVSVICTRYLADKYFSPIQERWKDVIDGFEIVDETFTVIQVDGQGLDAGQRVLELTSPLAMAGISIFFITTYFSDFILVPTYARRTVTTALEQRGFVFSRSADAFVSQLSPASPLLGHHHNRNNSQNSADWILAPTTSHGLNMPSTPPAKDLPELQRRTFDKLRRNKISPVVDDEMRLLTCAGHDDDPSTSDRLKSDLLQVLISTSASSIARTPAKSTNGALNGHHDAVKPPSSAASFLSITMTANDPISIFLEARLLDRLGGALLGNKSLDSEDVLVPISFDLQALPMEATGIVCGVAGCLAAGETGRERELGSDAGPDSNLDITFLSTAKAGIVLVKECDLDRAMQALRFGFEQVSSVVDEVAA